MKHFSTEYIVLKRQNYREWDRLMTIITPHHGKRSALVKGVRRHTSKLASGTEPCTVAQGVFLEGTSDLLILTGVAPVTLHPLLRNDFSRLSHALYATELIHALVSEGDHSPEIFALVKETLLALDTTDTSFAPQDITLAFSLRLLDLTGFKPQVFSCHDCGVDLEEDHLYSVTNDHRFVCSPCSTLLPDIQKIPASSVKLFRDLQTLPFGELLSTAHLEETTTLSALMVSYLSLLVGKPLKTQMMMDKTM